MSEKSILFMARTTRFHEFVRSLTISMDAEVFAATPDSPGASSDFDLLVLDADGIRADRLDQISRWLDGRGNIPMLLIMPEESLNEARIPARPRADFVCPGASEAELEVRVRRLLGEEDPFTSEDVVTVGGMRINLATYQVYLDDEPVDLTLMEYSLLAFMASHPNRTFNREVLLHRVWGFDYCGGTRTVDVHIRRIRSKVGPTVAAHITTVRGVGYLFKE